MTDTTPASTGVRAPDQRLAEVAAVFERLGRADLAERARTAANRLKRPATIVCVVGEFKQGKSSLVNALLGQRACPVDDDLATSAITLVRFGETTSAQVRRHASDGGESITEAIPLDSIGTWVSEAGNPGNRAGVERVEITVPSALLKQGLAVVDTPGMGGLGAGHAAATLGFLPFADGLLLVSDASAEISAPELDFLRRAVELCPTVMFVLTKIDLYPEWQRILDLDRGHLDRAGLRIPIVAVSSTLRIEALLRQDRQLNDESRIPELVGRLGDEVVKPARDTAVQRSVTEVRAMIGQLATGMRSELEMLRDPSTTTATIAALDEAKARLEHLRGPGSKWSTLVGDRISDLSNEVSFGFRVSMRDVNRMMDERIEELTKGDEWDELTRDLQEMVADEVAKVFVALEEGRARIRSQVVELLRDDEVDVESGALLTGALDVSSMWRGKQLEQDVSTGKKALKGTLTSLKGAQGGVLMFGMVGTFLPAAAGVLVASNPVLLGIGAVFGGMGLADDRKRKVAERRQAARVQTRQFLDDVQFEMGNQIGNLVRDIQRELRDEFGDRLGELLRTCTETAERAQADAHRTDQERTARDAELQRALAWFEQTDGELAALAGGAR
jgi:GTPase SAR1 family protein